MTAAVSHADVRAMLRVVSDLNSLERPEDFRAALLPGVRELVPCEIASYNEVDFDAEAMIAAVEPEDWLTDDTLEKFVRLGHQNPLVTRYQRTRDGRPYKWSDLITRRELHRTDLYRELYAQIEIEYQMAFCLPAPPGVVIAFALNRSRRDFSERDRVLLNLLRGPLIQALRTVQRYAALAERLVALERGLDHRDAGVVLLEPGRIGWAVSFASESARRVLGVDAGDVLPERLHGWIDARRSDPTGEAVPPLVIEAENGSRVAVHLLPAREPGGSDALLVETVEEILSLPMLGAAGLTKREAESLRLVALGRANSEIAAELQISVRTVQKHLENAYEKLGAASRTQAVQAAWSIARPRSVQESIEEENRIREGEAPSTVHTHARLPRPERH